MNKLVEDALHRAILWIARRAWWMRKRSSQGEHRGIEY